MKKASIRRKRTSPFPGIRRRGRSSYGRSGDAVRGAKQREEPIASEREVAAGLPIPWDDRREIYTREKGGVPEKQRIEEKKPRGDAPGQPQSRETRGMVRMCAAVLLGLMILASMTLLVSVVASRSTESAWQGEGATATGNPSGTEQEREPDRIVFVKQYDDESGLLTTAELYARWAPSVVSILSEGSGGSGVGSGFFLSEDGYVATVNHVVEQAESLTVVTADGSRHRAVRVAGNELTDLALLKIERENCPAVAFADSEKLLVGDRIIAIGTPASLDYAGSVCSGEISYVDRVVNLYDDEGQIQKKMTLLQTDAPLNPGNSGCPLFNEYGEVVGVVTMRLEEGYEGMGFGIPSGGARCILEAMMRGEELTEELLSAVGTRAPSLGILGEAQREEGVCGVRVLDFSSPQSPISYILKKGDLIVQIDGAPVSCRREVVAVIQKKSPGETVEVTVLRGGQWLSFRVPLTAGVTAS